ncbi:MAG TPA: co-chaperone GroES [Patescibacteria group bacterium]
MAKKNNSTNKTKQSLAISAGKLNIAPTAGYVLIEPLEAQTKTASGIYLPDTVSEKPQKGKVLAVGASEVASDGKEKKAGFNVGDEVIYKKWGANEVKIDGKEYLFAKFEDILAIVK